jgi:hypothetical protein
MCGLRYTAEINRAPESEVPFVKQAAFDASIGLWSNRFSTPHCGSFWWLLAEYDDY